MDQPISAAEANRKFSDVLREVRGGNSYVITSHGKPVARIIPYQRSDATRRDARTALLSRLEQQQATDIGIWTRDELYER